MRDALPPIEKLEEDLAPARLMLKLHKLLDCQDEVLTDGTLVESLRTLVSAGSTEELMLLRNERLLGLVRERADLRARDLKSATLAHLLRQAVVLTCTAQDTFLPAVLRLHMPEAVRCRARQILVDDGQVKGYLKDLKFTLEEVGRAREEDGPIVIVNKILRYLDFKYMAGDAGVAAACALLGVQQPWAKLAAQLDREERELKKTLKAATDRRNDIVHRGDRERDAPTGEPRSIAYSWTSHAVATISDVCYALHEIVQIHMRSLRSEAA